MNYISHYESPIGKMTMGSDGDALIGLWFEDGKYYGETLGKNFVDKDLRVFQATKKWLDVYFSGTEPDFIPKIKLYGSDFRLEVWKILKEIPYGATIAYGQIADKIAAQRCLSKMSAQAVGSAVGHNPITIIIPCHRVIGADGSVTGYAGGIWRKIKLLDLESGIVKSHMV